jgi:hypothetical protein
MNQIVIGVYIFEIASLTQMYASPIHVDLYC